MAGFVFAFEHGWRWNEQGAEIRKRIGAEVFSKTGMETIRIMFDRRERLLTLEILERAAEELRGIAPESRREIPAVTGAVRRASDLLHGGWNFLAFTEAEDWVTLSYHDRKTTDALEILEHACELYRAAYEALAANLAARGRAVTDSLGAAAPAGGGN